MSDIAAAIDAEIAPGRLILLCQPAVGGRLAGVIWQPPSLRLRSQTEAAFSRMDGIQPRSEGACRNISLPDGRSVDVVEAKELASLVLRRNPRWTCVLLLGLGHADPSIGELVLKTPRWRAPQDAHYAGPQLARGCSHQGFGRLRKLLSQLGVPLAKDKVLAPISAAEAWEEWRQIASLLTLSAALLALGGWPDSCSSAPLEPPAPRSGDDGAPEFRPLPRQVFLSPTAQLLSLQQPPRHFERHVCIAFGADKAGEIESTGVELGEFCLLLCKGNPRNVELLWLDEAADHAPPLAQRWPWSELVARREAFRTRVAYAQYLGLAAERLHRAQRLLDGKAASPLELHGPLAKLMYHALRVLYEAKRLRAGEALHVAPRGDEREHILRVRRGPLEGDLAPAALVAQGFAMLQSLRDQGAAHLPAATDRGELLRWLTDVRLRQHAMEALAAAAPKPPPTPLPVSRVASAASDEAEGDAECASVLAAIARLEAAEGVRVLFAVEQGSAMRGTSHAGSDRDVLAVFAHPRLRYFSFRPPRPTLRVSYPPSGDAAAEVELLGYEARHFYGMAAANNPSVFEALLSPIVYRANGTWLQQTRALLATTYDAPMLAGSWRHHARKNFREHVSRPQGPQGGDGVLRKKYLHVLRPLLSARWLERHHASGGAPGEWPPLELPTLLAQSPEVPPPVRAQIEAMLEPAERPRLAERGERIAAFDSYIEEELRDAVTAKTPQRGEEAKLAAAEAFDRLCMLAVEDVTR